MKNFNKYLIAMMGAATMFACDPLEDEIKSLEENFPAPSEIFEMTLEDADYKLAIIDGDTSSAYRYGSFSDLDDVKRFVPVILADKYPVLGDGSFADVTFKFYRGGNSEASAVRNGDDYEFSDADYESISTIVGQSGFLNDDTKWSVSDVLETAFASASADDIVAATYEYADAEYVSGGSAHAATFTTDLEGYSTVSVIGDDQEWEQDSYQSSTYAKMSGYSGGAQDNEDWLISPAIDLSSYSGQLVSLSISQALNYLPSGTEVSDNVNVYASSDYAGDVAAANWELVSFNAWPEGNNWDFITSDADISSMAGGMLYLGFKFESSSAAGSSTWEIGEVNVSYGAVTDTPSDEVTTYFQYDGSSWDIMDGVYSLVAADYDAMGAPGRYNNFSSSAEPEDFLPQFLATKFPYAQEDEEMVLAYLYYDGSTGIRTDHYTYVGGEWMAYSSTIDDNLSFGHNGSVWVADNTITLDVDFNIIERIEGGDRGASTTEYNNFYQGSNVDGGTWWSDEEITAVLVLYLLDQFGDAEEGQKYVLNYTVYTGSSTYRYPSDLFIKVGDTYEFVPED